MKITVGGHTYANGLARDWTLFYGRPGVRMVGYDNERGKGDHRHFMDVEMAYAFSSVEQLMVDFWSDVRTLRGVK